MKIIHPIRTLRYLLYTWLQKEQEERDLHAAAQLWQRSVTPCYKCARPVTKGSQFCSHCGFTQDRQTSGMQMPVQYSPSTITLGTQVAFFKLPDERPFLAYKRIKPTLDRVREKEQRKKQT